LIFLTGGARSGKSSLAISLATRLGAPVTLIATARADDDEMARRIEDHRLRRPQDWTVFEEPIDLVAAVRSAPDLDTVVIDCVTLWISNLMVERDDAEISSTVGSAIDAIGGRTGETIVISNEVGSGVVPMHAVGRRFRDLQGRSNQNFASAAKSAYLVVAGKTLRLQDIDDVV
jgi:adenosyl cobinamide kinase/adenosyl cobinamide phosphate guanylyltransferase